MDGRTEALGRILGRRTFRILAGGYLSGELKVGKKTRCVREKSCLKFRFTHRSVADVANGAAE